MRLSQSHMPAGGGWVGHPGIKHQIVPTVPLIQTQTYRNQTSSCSYQYKHKHRGIKHQTATTKHKHMGIKHQTVTTNTNTNTQETQRQMGEVSGGRAS